MFGSLKNGKGNAADVNDLITNKMTFSLQEGFRSRIRTDEIGTCDASTRYEVN